MDNGSSQRSNAFEALGSRQEVKSQEEEIMKKLKIAIAALLILASLSVASAANAAPPAKAKFYDFSDQLIDGEIKKPTTLYVEHRSRAKFERLLSLKKSFLPRLFRTAKESIFK